jgi:hypothetical protein
MKYIGTSQVYHCTSDKKLIQEKISKKHRIFYPPPPPPNKKRKMNSYSMKCDRKERKFCNKTHEVVLKRSAGEQQLPATPHLHQLLVPEQVLTGLSGTFFFI